MPRGDSFKRKVAINTEAKRVTNELPKPALQGGFANLRILKKGNNFLKLTMETPYKMSTSNARNPFLIIRIKS